MIDTRTHAGPDLLFETALKRVTVEESHVQRPGQTDHHMEPRLFSQVQQPQGWNRVGSDAIHTIGSH